MIRQLLKKNKPAPVAPAEPATGPALRPADPAAICSVWRYKMHPNGQRLKSDAGGEYIVVRGYRQTTTGREIYDLRGGNRTYRIRPAADVIPVQVGAKWGDGVVAMARNRPPQDVPFNLVAVSIADLDEIIEKG